MSTKRKPSSKIAQPVAKRNAKLPLKTTINESETAVSMPEISKADDNAAAEGIIEISSDSGSEYELSDGEQEAKPNGGAPAAEQRATQNGTQSTPKSKADAGDVDVDMADPTAPNDPESDQEPAQPTLGELARAHDTIDVPSALVAPSTALAAPGRSPAPPSLSSLGTVLTQALRTDDADLLESCLHTSDLPTVRNTIQRLDSTLAGNLLTKLAARMHRRPGRAGSLMTWVQWTLISHGGALATQPGLTKKLSELHRVLEERSRGLNSLLALKGKLDLLAAQMELRRGMQGNHEPDEDEDEDEDGVIYVEGEDSDAEMAHGLLDMDDDELPVTNGIVDDDSEADEESSQGADEEEELEAEEEMDENDVNHEDVEHEDVESEDEDSAAEAVAQPPAKKTRSSRRR
ncbi:Dip2/Utp12 family-domain-containing protein [Xylariomycetidae sp. FL0641]|nr:Dip2/Utp12 family-domain-containing protein [Xylariomycetidae sp. FL0641]